MWHDKISRLYIIMFQIHCNTSEEAIERVKEGTAWSALVIKPNFTMDLFTRMCSIAKAECENITQGIIPIDPLTDEIIDESTIHLHSDLSSE